MSKCERSGPGKYNPPYVPAKDPKAPAYSIGGRRNNEKLNINPGPAEFESFSPGPAAYAALNPSKIKKAAPAYSLGSRWHHESQESPFSGAKGFHCEFDFKNLA
ncbi:hypothetical protein HK098_002877 [Nowakowskiella sp. JEL0407]|nr:hypothetical protein HK098_002877 [Nowakowskiella sp. JEL0407]